MTEVRVTHPDRVLVPADGITKGEVVAYLRAVAPRMLPHVARRPLSLERFRASIDDGGFFQQSVPAHFPAWVPRVAIATADGRTTERATCESAEVLAFLANQGALTLHAWPARAPDVEHPDVLVLDLDPAEDDFGPVRRAALLLRDVLDDAGLAGFPMTTGSRGVHVLVPLDGRAGWDEVWEGAKAVGAALVARAPQELTRAFYKSQRRGRLYVDTGRARRGHTAVVPYTVRARPRAPVATPVAWDELADPEVGPRTWTVRNVLERSEDPWAGIWERGASLAAGVAALEALRPRGRAGRQR